MNVLVINAGSSSLKWKLFDHSFTIAISVSYHLKSTMFVKHCANC